MRIVAFVNNRAGWQAVRWLRERAQGELVGLVLHEEARRRYGEETLAAAALPVDRVLTANRLGDEATRAWIQALDADLGLSVYFGHILRPELLDLFPRGCINVHPAYLPYNRGAYPNVWPLVDGSPAGVTIHYMDAGVDTGDIVAQRRVAVRPADTARTLHRRLERAALRLLRDTWPALVERRAPRLPQDPDAGTQHARRDLAQLDEIDLDRAYTARDLLNLLRARTYPPYPAAFFRADGRRVYVRVTLEPEATSPPAALTGAASPIEGIA